MQCCDIKITREPATYVSAEEARWVEGQDYPNLTRVASLYIREPLQLNLGEHRVDIDPDTGTVDLPPVFVPLSSSTPLRPEYIPSDTPDLPIKRYQIPQGEDVSFMRGNYGGNNEKLYVDRRNRTLLHIGGREPIQLWPL